MSGYHAQVDALRESAAAARTACEQASEARLAEAFDGSGEAMPGSRSASLLYQAGIALGNDLSGWLTRATDYAGDLSAAADRYSVNEDTAASGCSAHAGD
ncbi:MAG: hypothetical protein GEV00_22515 [Actinophytocola sp.]|nr:hypothetical protein [Actinophytocola sp.]